ncbi:acyl-CoA thioesterase [Paraburkholderia xenovorans]|uniref:acyl-CoA thioesterase n=1 Tax=Paraburkholderia xenovorans TaxID=36873 RepID=UPI0038B7C98B
MSAPESSLPGRSEARGRQLLRERAACEFWTREKLRNADTDQFRHINNAAIATLFEAARMEILEHDSLKASMAGRNVVVAHLSIDFLKELYFPGTVEIGSATLDVGRTSFQLLQGLFIGSECVASARATCVVLDTQRGVPTLVPEPVRSHLLKGRADENASVGGRI